MATSNVDLTNDWSQVALNTDDHVLISDSPSAFEVAVTAADAAPTVRGHRIEPHEAITRGLLGEGYIWARNVGGGAAVLVVTKS